jgi:hypothetical protein
MPALRLVRRIDPSPQLRAFLEASGQIDEIADQSGREWSYVDDSLPREAAWTDEIVSRATLGFAIMDEANSIQGFYTRADRAQRAMDGAKVVLSVDVEVEDDDGEWPEHIGPDLPAKR